MAQDRKSQLDSRVVDLFKQVTAGICFKIDQALIERNLTDNDGNPQEPINQKTLEVLGKNLLGGLHFYFTRTRVNIPPGYQIDALGLTDQILPEQGIPTIEIDGNKLEISFNGKRPLIRRMDIPIDLDLALSQHSDGRVCFIDFGGKLNLSSNGTVIDFDAPPSLKEKAHDLAEVMFQKAPKMKLM